MDDIFFILPKSLSLATNLIYSIMLNQIELVSLLDCKFSPELCTVKEELFLWPCRMVYKC